MIWAMLLAIGVTRARADVDPARTVALRLGVGRGRRAIPDPNREPPSLPASVRRLCAEIDLEVGDQHGAYWVLDHNVLRLEGWGAPCVGDLTGSDAALRRAAEDRAARWAVAARQQGAQAGWAPVLESDDVWAVSWRLDPRAAPKRARRRGPQLPRQVRRVSIPKGTLLYHGTSAEDDFEDLDGPAWLSTSEATARRFVTWAGGAGTPRVLVYRVDRTIPSLAQILDTGDMARLVRVLDPDGDTDAPGELAELACARGYNGWHILHNYGYMESDTLLCEPKAWLSLVETRAIERS